MQFELPAQVRWQDVADVLVLTFVLYRTYLFIRGTVAVQVLIGIAMLAAAAFIADQLGLMLTSYLLQASGAVATLVVVVVFRDEIRRGLRRVSPVRWWRQRKEGAGATPSVAGTVAEAAFALGRQRIGALLVLPGLDPLEEHLTGGVELDALPSTEIAVAIFHTGSPIHDGAAVVQTGRVRRAGCFLPLAHGLPDHMGSRHRAALGLSEVSDAAVVVVSEERGDVSIVAAGSISHAPDQAFLTRRLIELRGGPAAAPVAPGPRVVRRTRDAIALVVIVAAVLAAWWVIVGEPGEVVTRTVSVQMRDVPEGLEASPPRPSEVVVHIRGPATRIDALSDSDVQAWVDLAGGKRGRQRVRLNASVPSGIEITEIVPSEVTVRLEPSE
jgi:diadenylate cyclase